MINKDTKIYCSFSQHAGNKGCKLFNTAFQYYGLNSIYKSFSVNDIEEAVKATKCLNFAGFAVSMPFKREVINFVDEVSKETRQISAANTIVNRDGKLSAFNTDYLAAMHLLKEKGKNKVIILGNGGYAMSVRYAASILDMEHETITREGWNKVHSLKDKLIFNCTPVEDLVLDKTNDYIDCIVDTATGKRLGIIQAAHQFKLYTGLEFPFKY
jgi:shikimate dehydrogenase